MTHGYDDDRMDARENLLGSVTTERLGIRATPAVEA